MSGVFKLILEMGKESEDSKESEEYKECPKCGCECDMEDVYCPQCGTKCAPAESKVKGARMEAMKKMMSEDDD
jgi:hypothetical protein